MPPSPSALRLRGAFFCSGREPAPFPKRVKGEDLKNNGKGAVHVDRKTYEEAVALHSDTVTHLLLLRCRQPADAEDCYQEVFLKLLTAKGPFRDQEHIKAWLIQVTLHEAVNLHRQFWHRKVGLLGESPFPPEAVAPESSAWEVLETLRTLPGHQRDVLYLHCVEGYSVEETATILGLRPGTVKSRLSRARAALRKQLQEEPL